MNTNEKLLKWLLRASGVVMLAALGAVVMPYRWMDEIHRTLGMGALPDAPIVRYLTRSSSLLYALHGALILFIACDVKRWLPIIHFLGTASVVFGLVMLAIDWNAGLPGFWSAVEGPFVIVLGGVILWLARRLRRDPF